MTILVIDRRGLRVRMWCFFLFFRFSLRFRLFECLAPSKVYFFVFSFFLSQGFLSKTVVSVCPVGLFCLTLTKIAVADPGGLF